MFSKRRKNYRVFVITALIISICALIIAILWPSEPNTSNNINVNAETEVKNTDDIDKENSNDVDISVQDNSNNTKSETKSYYIVKKNGDVISVYFVTEDGTQVKLEDTEIIYDLLLPEDQSNFERGIILEGQEELSSLLQDFEG